MTQTILNGVSRKMRLDFMNGLISDNVLIRQYECNSKETETFSIFGYGMQDIIVTVRTTHNPLLKARLQQTIQDIRGRRMKGNEQNKLTTLRNCKCLRNRRLE